MEARSPASVGMTGALRRAVLPPRIADPVRTRSEQRDQELAHTIGLVAAILTDLLIYAALARSPSIDARALRAFVGAAVPLLAIDCLVLQVSARRGPPLPTWLRGALAFVEIGVGMAWVQLTGIVSSYFLFFGPMMIIHYRSAYGYWMGLWTAGWLCALHAAGVVLEDLSLLHPEGLFTAPPGAHATARAFRWISLASIEGVYAMVFFANNFAVARMREKDAALSAARREFARAVEEAVPGRLVGEEIGAYRLVELLGAGGAGEVYRATRIEDGGAAAVKVLHRRVGAAADARARFEREIAALRRIAAPGVVTVLDAGQTDDGLSYLAMELLVGEDVAALLRRRGRLPYAEVLPIVEGIARALDAAHAAGIVHRDVKPANVFLADGDDGGPPTVKLLDFSIARLSEVSDDQKLTMTNVVLGTPGYLAPEQIVSAFGAVGPATDTFALGTLVYRALTGRPAFDAPHVTAALHAALHEHPVPPSRLVPGLPEEVDAVIALALAKRPGQRYATAGALAADLRAACEGRLSSDVWARVHACSGGVSDAVTRTMREAIEPTLPAGGAVSAAPTAGAGAAATGAEAD